MLLRPGPFPGGNTPFRTNLACSLFSQATLARSASGGRIGTDDAAPPCNPPKKYENKYRDVQFVGSKSGTELARYYQKADVFVFPSRTDTYGVVMLESIACGTPVAAYDVTGPRDVITNGLNGYLGEDLEKIALSCLDLNRQVVHESSKIHTWEKATQQFMETLVEV